MFWETIQCKGKNLRSTRSQMGICLSCSKRESLRIVNDLGYFLSRNPFGDVATKGPVKGWKRDHKGKCSTVFSQVLFEKMSLVGQRQQHCKCDRTWLVMVVVVVHLACILRLLEKKVKDTEVAQGGLGWVCSHALAHWSYESARLLRRLWSQALSRSMKLTNLLLFLGAKFVVKPTKTAQEAVAVHLLVMVTKICLVT